MAEKTRSHWVIYLAVGFVATVAGQPFVAAFTEAIQKDGEAPEWFGFLFLLGVGLSALGSALFSRSSPGLLGSRNSTSRGVQFGAEVTVTATMLGLSAFCGWAALNLWRIGTNRGEPVRDRLLTVPLGIGFVVVGLLILIVVTAFCRHTPGTPWTPRFGLSRPLVPSIKQRVRNTRCWRWIARPRGEWNPTVATSVAMRTVLGAGYALRIGAGLVAGTALSGMLHEGLSWWTLIFLALVAVAGFGGALVALPSRLLPARDVSRTQQTFESLADTALSSLGAMFVGAILTALFQGESDYVLTTIIWVAILYFLPLFAIITRANPSLHSIRAWRNPVLVAQRSLKEGKRAKRRLMGAKAHMFTPGTKTFEPPRWETSHAQREEVFAAAERALTATEEFEAIAQQMLDSAKEGQK